MIRRVLPGMLIVVALLLVGVPTASAGNLQCRGAGEEVFEAAVESACVVVNVACRSSTVRTPWMDSPHARFRLGGIEVLGQGAMEAVDVGPCAPASPCFADAEADLLARPLGSAAVATLHLAPFELVCAPHAPPSR